MTCIVKWKTKDGSETRLSISRREDAIVQAAAAIRRGDTDVEVIEEGKPLPRSEYAPARSKAR